MLIAIVIVFWQLATQVGDRSILNRLDYIFYDWRAQLAAFYTQAPADTDVVIVDIDEASIFHEGHWPWSRFRISTLLDRLKTAEATVVAFDIVFSEPEAPEFLVLDEQAPTLTADEHKLLDKLVAAWQPDQNFARYLAELDTILGFFLHTDTALQTSALPTPLATLPDNHVLIRSAGYTGPLQELAQAATGSGFVTTFPDADGVIRRTPVVMAHDGKVYPSLALAATMAYLLAEDLELTFVPVGDIQALSQFRVTDTPINTDAVGRVLVPFQQGRGYFRYIPAWQVLAGALEAGELNGKMVFVGTSAIGLSDLVSTPFGTAYPGVEVQALVAQSILSGSFPFRPVWTPGALLVFQVFLLLLLMWMFPGRRPLTMVLSSIVVSLVLVAGNTLLWAHWQLEFPLVSTLLLTQAVFSWYLVTEFIQEYTIERRIRGMFAQYVPPAHINQMLDTPELYSMAGESKELTVLFADIRSFTTISEQLTATQLKTLLNIYFTPITEAIFRHDGTIDKYVGDMVMAFWGAPVDDSQHRQKAIRTALEMQAITKRLSADLEAQGLPAIRIGVGLNTGLMNVGDMGSEYRKAYTVLGDAVNLGSRLEGLTKFYGVEILLGEDTVKGIDTYAFRFCDRLQVKGKDIPINAFEPLGEIDQLSAACLDRLDRFHQAIQHYRERQWQLADDLLQQLHHEEPECRLYSLYRERIAVLREQNLPQDWDGAYRHTTK